MSILASILSSLLAAVVIPFADPFILHEDGIYYMYGTSSDDGIGVVVSEDLDSWYSPDGSPLFFALREEDSYGDHWYWAPEVYHIGDRYFMYYSCQEHICVAEADSPLGPFRQRVKEPIIEGGNIDNSLFINSDGTPYMFWVHFHNGNEVWSAQLTDDYSHFVPGTEKFCIKAEQPWELIQARVNEGPAVVIRDGRYYLTYSANDYRSVDYGIGYATADSVSGPWTKYDGNPILRRPCGLYGVGHHAFFKDAEGHDRIVFHSHNGKGKIGPRIIHIASWGIGEDGIMYVDSTSITTPHLEQGVPPFTISKSISAI